MPVFKNRRGHWAIDVRDPQTGQRVRWQSPLNTKGAAQTYEAYIRGELAKGLPLAEVRRPGPAAAPTTFAKFAEEWFTTYVQVNNKYTERRSKERMLRLYLFPAFGTKPIADITRQDIETFKQKLVAKGLSPKTINNCLAVLGTCLRHALDAGELDRVPRIQRLKVPPVEMDFLSYEEMQLLLSDQEEPGWNTMILLALHTGMRVGELMGLTWRAVNLNREVLTVQQAVVDGRLTTPKNHKVRHLPMNDAVHDSLRRRPRAAEFVFTNRKGQPLHLATASTALKRVCRRVGLRRIRGWHTLRHSFASHLVMSGVPLRSVQDLLGHSTIAMTERYSHLAPSATLDAVQTLMAPPAPLHGAGQRRGNGNQDLARVSTLVSRMPLTFAK